MHFFHYVIKTRSISYFENIIWLYCYSMVCFIAIFLSSLLLIEVIFFFLIFILHQIRPGQCIRLFKYSMFTRMLI
jgi:hypothetical protein